MESKKTHQKAFGHAMQQAASRVKAASAQRRLRKVEEKRRAILDAAAELFSRYGLHGVSLDQVAELADVSKTNLLYYFSRKEDLYLAVLRDLLAGWLEPLQRLNAQQNPAEAIGDYIRCKLAASRDVPQASRLFCLEIIQGAPLLADTLKGELLALVEAKSEVIRHWVAQGILAPVEPQHFIFSLWAVTQHYADFAVQVQALTGKTLQDADFFEETVRNVQHLVLDGVLARQVR